MSIKLKELLTLKYGKRQIDVEDKNGTIPIYGTGGVFGKANTSLYSKPSILLGRKGTIDKPFWVDHPFWCVDTMFYSIIDDTKVVPKYLFYNLLNIDFSKYNEGTTIPSLRIETLNDIDIALHSNDEQLYIVDILGSIDEKIEANTQTINKINKFASVLIINNSPSNTELKMVIRFIKGKKPVENGTEKLPYLSIDGITSGVYSYEFSDGMILANPFDILMVMDGASSGSVYSHQKGIVSSTLARIDVDSELNDYLYWFLLSQKDIIKSRNTGSAIPHANKDYIGTLHFNYEFAKDGTNRDKLHALRSKIIDIQQENAELVYLKQLYLKKFFG